MTTKDEAFEKVMAELRDEVDEEDLPELEKYVREQVDAEVSEEETEEH